MANEQYYGQNSFNLQVGIEFNKIYNAIASQPDVRNVYVEKRCKSAPLQKKSIEWIFKIS